MRAAKAMRAAISTANSRAGSQRCVRGGQGVRHRCDFRPRPRRAALQHRAGGAERADAVGARRRGADEGSGQRGTAEHVRPQRFGTFHAPYRGATCPRHVSFRVGDHLSVVPRNDPALVDSVARRFGFLPADQIRLSNRARPARAIAGRRSDLRRPASDRSSNCSRWRRANRSRSWRSIRAAR